MIVHPDITAVNYQANYIDYAPCVNPPTTLLDYITPCFILRKDDLCTELFLYDETEYNAIDPSLVTITVSVFYRSDLNDEYVQIINPCTFPSDSQEVYKADCGNGYYKLEIQVQYTDGLDTSSETLIKEITLDCCKCGIEDLKSEVKTKLSTVGCKVHEYECIGKDRTKLQEALYGLSNALFYLETASITNHCKTAHQVECFLKSIKNFC